MISYLLVEKSSSQTIPLPTTTYRALSEFIIAELKEKGPITLTDLLDQALAKKEFQTIGNLSWCLLNVKRDLQARGIIQVTVKLSHIRIQWIQLPRVKKNLSPTKHKSDAG